MILTLARIAQALAIKPQIWWNQIFLPPFIRKAPQLQAMEMDQAHLLKEMLKSLAEAKILNLRQTKNLLRSRKL